MSNKDIGYARLNAELALKLGIGHKLVDLQMKHDPKVLHDILSAIPTNPEPEQQKATLEGDGYEIELPDKDDPSEATRLIVDPKLFINPAKFERDKELLRKLKLE